MILEQTITWLEMTSPEELRPGRVPPAPVELVAADRSLLPLLRTTNRRVGEPHGWTSRPGWSEDQWAEHLASPGVIELVAQPGDEVELTVFGLVPELVGRGFGRHLLTLAARLAWETRHPGGAATRRVWLHTSSSDHAHAQLPGSGVPRGPHRGPAQACPRGRGRLTGAGQRPERPWNRARRRASQPSEPGRSGGPAAASVGIGSPARKARNSVVGARSASPLASGGGWDRPSLASMVLLGMLV